jgi:hypothetical protein
MSKSIVKTVILNSWASQLVFQNNISVEPLNNSYVIKNKVSFALIKHPSEHTSPVTND